jgi:inner membrane protein YidH
MSKVRRPQSVYGVGTEPDPRASLANERTALAGLRTALGLVAAGVGLAALAHLTESSDWFRLVALVLCLLGAWLAGSTLWQWAGVERALRQGEPLPAPIALPPLAVALAVVAIALVVVLAWNGLS